MRTPRTILLLHAGLICCLLSAPGAPTLAAFGQATAQSPSQRAMADPLDINVATVAELKALPGMGLAYARRVIENRPYSAKNQLVTRGILPQSVYDGIRDRIVAHRVQAIR